MDAVRFADSVEILLVASELNGKAVFLCIQDSGIAHSPLERAGLDVYLVRSVGKKDRCYSVQDELVA